MATLKATLRPSSRSLASKTTPKPRSGMPELVDRLAGRARQALDEGEAEIAGHRIDVGKAVTGSLEAYQH